MNKTVNWTALLSSQPNFTFLVPSSGAWARPIRPLGRIEKIHTALGDYLDGRDVPNKNRMRCRICGSMAAAPCKESSIGVQPPRV